MDHSIDKLDEILKGLKLRNDHEIDYFLLPITGSSQKPSIDWDSVTSVLFSYKNAWEDHENCPLQGNARVIHTKTGAVCKCMLQNSLVYAPHNETVYCIERTLEHLNGRSRLTLKDGVRKTYMRYYRDKYVLRLPSTFFHLVFL